MGITMATERFALKALALQKKMTQLYKLVGYDKKTKEWLFGTLVKKGRFSGK